MSRFLLFSCLSLFLCWELRAQTADVSGKITDSNGTELPGVNILIKGTQRGTVTDASGNFALQNVKNNDVLSISVIGYESVEVPVGGRSVINFQMTESITNLAEIMVVGYGTMEKRDVTGSVGQVKGDEIQNLPVAGIDRALQGRTPGVVVAANSGAPGSNTTVRIRGTSSIYGNNDPLYVLDGVPLGENIGGIQQIVNTSDVESVEILKDASAAAIYGSRGANGVILITTKKGKSGAPRISVNSYYGVKNAWRRAELADANEFARVHLLAHQNGGTQPIPAIANAAPGSFGKGTDWWDEVNQTGAVQNYDFSLMGGTDKVKYSTSVGYFSDKGYIKTSDFDRLTFRINTEYQISKNIKLGNNFSIIHSTRRGFEENTGEGGGVIASIYQLDPITPVYKTREQLEADAINEGVDISNPYNVYHPSLYTNRGNLVARLARNESDNKDLRMMGNVFVDVNFLKGFTFRSDLGLHLRANDSYNFAPKFWLSAVERGDESVVSRGYQKNVDWVWTNTLAYQKTINKHSLNAMAGVTAEEYVFESLFGRRFDTPTNDPSLWYLDAAAVAGTITGGASQNNLISYLGRVNYVFDERFLFTASVRADGSSRFAQGNRWGYFPSMSVGWRLSEESFFSSIANDVVSDLKLRAGWGQIGNQRITNNAYINLLAGNDFDRYAFGPNEGFLKGLRPQSIGNPLIQWETVEQLNFGIDAGLMNNKLTLTADYFIKDTKDNLLRLPQPLYVGSPSPWANAGQIRNSGLEFNVGYRNFERKLKYNINANVSFLKNEVLSLATGEPITGENTRAGSPTRTEVGQPIAAFYGWVTDGIFQNMEEISAGNQPNARPGDFRFKDLNNDGIIDNKDRTFLGSPHPDKIFGMNVNLEYGRFDLNVFFQGQSGNKIFMYEKYFSWVGDGSYNTIKGLENKAWRGEGTSNSQPIISSNAANNNFRISDWYMSDASYLRVKNIQLGYNVPVNRLAGAGVQSIRVWIGAENLLTFTGFEGLDPEVGANHGTLGLGMNQYVYPAARTYMGGLMLKF